MRISVDLDRDVEQLLKRAAKQRGISIQEALNRAVRAGLWRTKSQRKNRFVQQVYAMGAEQHFRWDKALAAAEAIEDEELIRKVSVRK